MTKILLHCALPWEYVSIFNIADNRKTTDSVQQLRIQKGFDSTLIFKFFQVSISSIRIVSNATALSGSDA